MTSNDSLTLHLDHQANRWLVRARADDGIPASERIRAGLALWCSEPVLSARIDEQAAAMRAEGSAVPVDRVKLRITLNSNLRKHLIDARVNDSIPTAVRVRAVVQLWHDDPEIRALIDARASDLRRNRRSSSLNPAV